jgi:ABC-type Na+ efflux pump permease subunit
MRKNSAEMGKNMKHNFRGWKTVYGITFRQSANGAGFKVVTTLITLVILGIFVVVNIFAAKPDKADKSKVSPVKSVYVLDNSGLKPTDYKSVNPVLSEEKYKDVKFIAVTGQSREEVINKAKEASPGAIAVIITMEDNHYLIEAVVPDGAAVSKGEAQALLKQVTSGFETGKLIQSGLSAEQLTTVLKPVSTTYLNIGENANEIVEAIKIAAPMLFGFMLYMMLILYGQTVTKSVSIEKTSKLMETLLTSVHPYALITGKVLAVTTMALLQFVTWIAACFVGLYGGNAIAHAIYPQYQNTAVTAINFLRDNIGKSAMSPSAVIMATIFFLIGFLFYCTLAGLAGSMVTIM